MTDSSKGYLGPHQYDPHSQYNPQIGLDQQQLLSLQDLIRNQQAKANAVAHSMYPNPMQPPGQNMNGVTGRQGRMARLAVAKLAVTLALLDPEVYQTFMWAWEGDKPGPVSSRDSYRKVAEALHLECGSVTEIEAMIDEVTALVGMERKAGLHPPIPVPVKVTDTPTDEKTP